MDPTLLAYTRNDEWERLSRLASQRRLNPEEAREFLRLYRSVSKDLSRVQSVAPDSEIAARLANILHRSRQQFTSVPAGFKSTVVRFFAVQLPAAMWDVRWYFVGTFIFSVIIAVGTTVWLVNDTAALFGFIDEASAKKFAQSDFVNYYKDNPNAVFAVGVWTNNAWIALQWVTLGITGIYVVYGLIMNAINVGVAGAVMFHFGRAEDFFFYILPHGMPELTCIFLAAAAGFKIFTAWIIPGNLTRGQSLARGARSLFSLGLGLVVFLFLSGLIEGFITPNNIPVPIKLAIGFGMCAAMVIYAIVLGRPAHRAGIVGDLKDEQVGYRVLTVA